MQNYLAHILLIDDQPEALKDVVKLLIAKNFRVSQASSPQSGLHRARAILPDLIVLDLYMPGMNGFSLCRLLQEDTATRDIPIIFLSSSLLVEDRIKGLELGGVDFVSKPCYPPELLARIRVHLQLHRSTDKLNKNPAGTTERPEQVVLNAAVKLILSNLQDVPTLAEIAQAVGTSDKTLLRIFRHELGTTVFAFVREAKINQAKSLLANNPTLPIEDIAALLGFSSAANFSTAFKSREGLSPSQYRRIFSAESQELS